MKNDIEQTNNSSRRLHIDRKMIGILSIFTVLGVCLVISIIIATNTLSALRGFASMQAHWTEVRKESTLQLVNYLHTGEESYYARFDSALSKIYSAQKIRLELLKNEPDYRTVRSDFLTMHTVPHDVNKMISTFERFHDFSDFKEAIQQWVVSEQLVWSMKELASESRRFIEKGSFTEEMRTNALSTAIELDKELTAAQYKLAAALSSGTRFLNTIILWISSSLGFILLATGGFLSFRFLKSVKRWSRAIEISEQQYRSLFEQNPNAVYSISKDGRFLTGNKVLEKMTGYSLQELREEKFARFVDADELKKVNEHFQKAVDGDPQTYETVGIRRNGERTYAEITNIPIYVDGEIRGVYGIAQDITDRKKAEQRIKEQLEEKTCLLTEIHDRVKNNLALISSLLQLQRETIETEEERTYLDSTISRIHSMAMVHERLYHTDTFSSIRMDEYVRELSELVTKSSSADAEQYDLTIDTNPVTLSINQAIPTGLLLNELLTNACKYAFGDNEKGSIRVRLIQEGEEIVLQVVDNGRGLPAEINIDDADTLGMRLTKVLIQQLEADYTLESKNGTSFTIRFPAQFKVSKSA